MTSPDRLDAIFDRLGELERTSATAHVQIQSSVDRLGDSVDVLADRVKVQNGRVGKLEAQVGELQIKTRIAERDDHEDDERRDFIREKTIALVTGSFLVILGALLGYFF